MARREKLVTITDDGRDKGKTFLIRELPAFQAEWWAVRVLIVMGNAGVSIPSAVSESGMAGVAFLERTRGVVSALLAVGLKILPGVNPDALKPLLDEMLECIQYVPPGMHSPQALETGMMSQVDDIKTIAKLRAEVLELHLGFSLAGAVSILDTSPPASPAS